MEMIFRISRHWAPFILFYGLVLIAISGVAGTAYGISALFRDDPQWVQGLGFWERFVNGHARLGQTAAVLLVGCLAVATLFLDEYKGIASPPKTLVGTLQYLALPVLLLGSLAFLTFLIPLDQTIPQPNNGDILFAFLGQCAGWAWLILLLIINHFNTNPVINLFQYERYLLFAKS